MKKALPVILFSCLMTEAYPQATITQANFPVVGTTWTEFEDNNYGAHTIPPVGAGQTWNYATAFNITDTGGIAFVAPSSLPPPFNTDFPAADLAVFSPSDTSAQFFKSMANGFWMDGFSIHGSQAMPPLDKFDFMPDQLFFPAPLTYGPMTNSASRVTIIQPAAGGNPGLKFTIDLFSNINANAWGSLTTPSGTYPNTIRVRRMEYNIDSSFIDILGTGNYTFVSTSGPKDTAIIHFFMNSTNPVVLMTINEDPGNLGTSDGATFLVNIPFSIDEVSTPSAAWAYPNPAGPDGPVTITARDRFDRLVITDGNGKTVYSTGGINADRTMIRTDNLSAGTYHYRVYDARGKAAGSGTFIVTQ